MSRSSPPQSVPFRTTAIQGGIAIHIRSVGPGLTLEFDSRDVPTGPRTGRYFKAETILNDENFGSSRTYQSYEAGYTVYRDLPRDTVLAWQIKGCHRGGSVPLWDACRIPLRGFAAFDYLGESSASGQVEARIRLRNRWGLVVFGGGGWAGKTFSETGEEQSTRSVGAGIRFEVLPAKRLNMRLDFASSDEDNGIYLAIGEAF